MQASRAMLDTVIGAAPPEVARAVAGRLATRDALTRGDVPAGPPEATGADPV
ncbi:hypothetical protein [Streptosporangium sp. NPDC023615]|uniref:hypothetical protein n=1 Tax=Streptosporangium sp. NPDC023615 TaxID=3154794 RepID=UPI0034280416